jgi:hypothetical protein
MMRITGAQVKWHDHRSRRLPAIPENSAASENKGFGFQPDIENLGNRRLHGFGQR